MNRDQEQQSAGKTSDGGSAYRRRTRLQSGGAAATQLSADELHLDADKHLGRRSSPSGQDILLLVCRRRRPIEFIYASRWAGADKPFRHLGKAH